MAQTSKSSLRSKTPKVVIAMGSKSDLSTMLNAVEALKHFKISYDLKILSAHRTPKAVASFALGARENGVQVVIAGAGGAAHLPGMIAAYTDLPVIGVPVSIGALQGQDALLSIVQMPKGIPVATMAIGGAFNAGVLAAQILSLGDTSLQKRLAEFKLQNETLVLKQKV